MRYLSLVLLLILLSTKVQSQVFASFEFYQGKVGLTAIPVRDINCPVIQISNEIIPIKPYVRFLRGKWHGTQDNIESYADQFTIAIGTGFESETFTLLTGLNYNHFWNVTDPFDTLNYYDYSFEIGIIKEINKLKNIQALIIIDVLNSIYNGAVTLGLAWTF